MTPADIMLSVAGVVAVATAISAYTKMPTQDNKILEFVDKTLAMNVRKARNTSDHMRENRDVEAVLPMLPGYREPVWREEDST